MGGSSTPKPPDYAAEYGKGIDIYLSKLPQLLAAEQSAREQYDPERIRQALALEQEFDPNRAATRDAFSSSILADLLAGHQLSPEALREDQQRVRGAQAARGNVYGPAASNQETRFLASEAENLYGQRLARAGTLLSTPSVATPDRSAAYTQGGGGAGALGVGFGQQQYQNQLAAANAQGNPWASALGGAASGAAAGSALGPWGAIIGGAAGGVGGYFASDERLKENIVDTGERTKDEIPIVEFNYRGEKARLRGVIAQMVEKVRPDAVREFNGFKAVNYDLIGLEMSVI